MTKGSTITVLVCSLACLSGCKTVPEAPSPPARPPLNAPTPATGYFPYCMQKGDTLYSIGQRFKVPWSEIARINDLQRLDDLAIGTLLIIPHVSGVTVPELVLPSALPGRGSARRSGLRPEDLHRGNSASPYWWPTRGRVVRPFGQTLRGLPEHGIGIAAPVGTEVCAVAAGTVITCVRSGAERASAWGNVVAVSHSANVVSWYAYLGDIDVEKGQRVDKGEPIGTVGASGGTDEGELAFRLFRNDHLVDPEDYLP